MRRQETIILRNIFYYLLEQDPREAYKSFIRKSIKLYTQCEINQKIEHVLTVRAARKVQDLVFTLYCYNYTN